MTAASKVESVGWGGLLRNWNNLWVCCRNFPQAKCPSWCRTNSVIMIKAVFTSKTRYALWHLQTRQLHICILTIVGCWMQCQCLALHCASLSALMIQYSGADIAVTLSQCVCVCVWVGVYVSTIKQNPWQEWLETWHSSSPRQSVKAHWFWVQNVNVQGHRSASLHILGLLPNPWWRAFTTASIYPCRRRNMVVRICISIQWTFLPVLVCLITVWFTVHMKNTSNYFWQYLLQNLVNFYKRWHPSLGIN